MICEPALPIGEYAAVTLLMFFGLKSIKDAWDLPSSEVKSGEKSGPELDEYAEAEELVKEKVILQHGSLIFRLFFTCDILFSDFGIVRFILCSFKHLWRFPVFHNGLCFLRVLGLKEAYKSIRDCLEVIQPCILCCEYLFVLVFNKKFGSSLRNKISVFLLLLSYVFKFIN